MSDRGRNRRPARSTKATPAKPAAAEPDATSEAEDAPATEPTAEVTEAAEPAAEVTKATEPIAEAAEATEPAAEAAETVETDISDEPEASDEADNAEKSENSENSEKDDKADKPKPKGKAPAAPLTKAEKRAAARVAAHKAARRRRTGQLIAGTLIVLITVGGAFAGMWYFGDRAEKQKTMCKKPEQSSYPPLLGGFDKRLADEPKTEAGTQAKVGSITKTELIKGECKTVKAGDTVVVNYIGLTYKDGKVFDSSWQRKQTFPVQVGMLEQRQQQQVIEGWDRGLVGLKVGTRVILDVPAKQAYGDPAPEGYPAGDLRFYIDILDIQAPDAAGGGLTVPGN